MASSTLAEVSVEFGTATVKLSGEDTGITDNWVGGESSLSVPVAVTTSPDIGGITGMMYLKKFLSFFFFSPTPPHHHHHSHLSSFSFFLVVESLLLLFCLQTIFALSAPPNHQSQVTPKILVTSKECEVEKGPSATLSVQLALPSALKSAFDTMSSVLKTAQLDGLPGSAELEKEYTITLDGTDTGVSVDLSSVVTGDLKMALGMSGTDITIKVLKSDIKIFQSGIALPLKIDVVVMDPNKVKLPISKACGKGSRVCNEADYSEYCVGVGSTFSVQAKGCQALCSAIKNIASKPLIEETLDVAVLMPKAQVTCGSDKCISVGDTSSKCENPTPDDVSPSPTNDTLSAGIMSTPSSSVLGVTAMLALLSAVFL